MIQAVFSKIWIDEAGKTSTEYTNVYNNIVSPIENTLMKENIKLAPAKADANFIDELLKSYSKFFEKGLNNELLVETEGFEPLTLRMRTVRSPS